MALKDIYYAIEDKYYSFMDFLNDKLHLPVYKFFVNPIEEQGIPSFPIALLSLVVLSVGIGFLATNVLFPQLVDYRVAVLTQAGAVDGADVTLLISGKELVRKSENGVAIFEKVPAGQKAQVKVLFQGFEPFVQDVDLAQQSIQISLKELQSELPKEASFTLLVRDNSNAPVGFAKVTYFDSAKGSSETVFSNAEGVVDIKIGSPSDSLTVYEVSKDGFSPSAGFQVNALEGVRQVILAGNFVAEEKGSLGVTLKNSAGERIEGVVTVFRDGFAKEVDAASTTNGFVRFESVVPIGSQVYIAVNPLDSKYAPYDGVFDVKTVKKDEEVEFIAILESKSATSITPGQQPVVASSELKVKVTSSSDAAPLADAQVQLFSIADGKSKALSTGIFTDPEGSAVLNVGRQSSLYLAVYKEGFIPKVHRTNIVGGRAVAIALDEAIPGNNGDLKVEVIDDNKQAVSGASVELYDSEGFFLGVPTQTTYEDGVATFYQLPVDKVIFAKAVSGTRKGKSNEFQLSFSQEHSVKVELEPDFGKLNLSIVDAVTNVSVAAAISISKSGADVKSCSSTSSCIVDIPANRELKVVASNSNYAQAVIEKVTVAAGETLSLKVSLIPNDLAKNLALSFDGFYDVESNEKVSTEFLDAGKYYWLRFTLNIPDASKNQRTGIYVRVGDVGGVPEEPAEITFYKKSFGEDGGISYGNAIAGTSYALLSCDSEANVEKPKWLEYQFEGVSGTFHLQQHVKLFVKPNFAGDKNVAINYRAYTVKSGLFARYPTDSSLGTSENSAAKLSCNALTLQKSMKVSKGRSICSEKLCLELSFKDIQIPPLNVPIEKAVGFKVNLGGQFSSIFKVRAFQPLPASDLKLSFDGKEIVFDSQVLNSNPQNLFAGTSEEMSAVTVSIPSMNSGEVASGEVSGKAILPTKSAKMAFDLTADSEAIFSSSSNKKNYFVEVVGSGKIKAAIAPRQSASKQSENSLAFTANDLNGFKLTLQSEQGVKVTDAKVSIEEIEGSPFATVLESSQLSIQGENSQSRGKDGEYLFSNLRPSTVGKAVVKIYKVGYQQLEIPITVIASNFMSLSLTTLQFNDEESCKGKVFELSNKLDAKVEVVISSDACIEVTATSGVTGAEVTEGNAKYFIESNGKAQFFAKPKLNAENCQVKVAGSINGFGSVVQAVSTSNACGAAFRTYCRTGVNSDCSQLQNFICGAGNTCIAKPPSVAVIPISTPTTCSPACTAEEACDPATLKCVKKPVQLPSTAQLLARDSCKDDQCKRFFEPNSTCDFNQPISPACIVKPFAFSEPKNASCPSGFVCTSNGNCILKDLESEAVKKSGSCDSSVQVDAFGEDECINFASDKISKACNADSDCKVFGTQCLNNKCSPTVSVKDKCSIQATFRLYTDNAATPTTLDVTPGQVFKTQNLTVYIVAVNPVDKTVTVALTTADGNPLPSNYEVSVGKR